MTNKYPSWFLGVVAALDEEQNIKQTKGGVRYRIRRFGIDEATTPADKLLFFDCMIPLTSGMGDGEKAKSVVLSVGDIVFGLHTDAPDHQRGVILGGFARTQLVNYDDIITTEDLTRASGGDQSSSAQPQPSNLNSSQAGDSLLAEDEEQGVLREVVLGAISNFAKAVKPTIPGVGEGTFFATEEDPDNPAPPITVNTLPPGWRVVEGGFVEQIDGRIVGEVNEDGTINTD
jgi:hypothetical protein